MSSGAHDIRKESAKYIKVGAALLALTILTVAASRLNVGIALGVFIALLIATFKGSLVASFFMHLIAENRWIYLILIFTAALLIFMFLLIIFAKFNVYEGLKYVS